MAIVQLNCSNNNNIAEIFYQISAILLLQLLLICLTSIPYSIKAVIPMILSFPASKQYEERFLVDVNHPQAIDSSEGENFRIALAA